MKTYKKVGFKFSWETTEQPEMTPEYTVINTLEQPIIPTAFGELAEKIENLKKYMTTTAYARLKKVERITVVSTYEFYLSLFNEFTLKNLTT